MSQLWSVNSMGGYMYSDELSDVLRMQVLPTARFRQFCDAKDFTDKGLHRGDTANWNVYSKLAQRGGQVLETQKTPETSFSVRQKSLTVTEYMNSVPFTQKLDNLSKHPVLEIIIKVLKIDCGETLDETAHAQVNSSKLKVQPTSGTSLTQVTFSETGVSASNTTVAMNNVHFKAVVDNMKERNIPAYMGDDYFVIARPLTFSQLKDDLEAIHQYTSEGFGRIQYGEIGKYYNGRCVEQTAIAKGGAEDSTTWNSYTADAWNGATVAGGGTADWAFFFGEDTVAECIVVPEEIRGRIPGDFGRDRGVAWYYLGGFGICHGSTTAAADILNARIVKWDSAA